MALLQANEAKKIPSNSYELVDFSRLDHKKRKQYLWVFRNTIINFWQQSDGPTWPYYFLTIALKTKCARMLKNICKKVHLFLNDDTSIFQSNQSNVAIMNYFQSNKICDIFVIIWLMCTYRVCEKISVRNTNQTRTKHFLKFPIESEANYLSHPKIFHRHTYLNMDILVRRLMASYVLSRMVEVFCLR